jgi:CAAX protease family protein
MQAGWLVRTVIDKIQFGLLQAAAGTFKIGHQLEMGEGVSGSQHPDDLKLVVAWVITLFGLTALGAGPLYLFGLNVQHISPQNISPLVGIGIELTAYAPSLAALIVAAFVGGGVRALLMQLRRWRVHVVWYVIALMGPLMLFLLGRAVNVVMSGRATSTWLALPSGFALFFAIGSIVAGSLGEEIGWRGFGQARLQRRYGALPASLVIGLIWTVWHDWGLFAPGGLASFTLGGFGLGILRMCALSVLYAWLYNGSRQSLPVAMAAHAGHNIANNIVPSAGNGIDLGEIVIFLYAAAAIVVVVLTRNRLGASHPLQGRSTASTDAADTRWRQPRPNK